MKWEVIDTGVASAEENMRIDAALLQRLAEERRPILHFYDWEGDTATYGHFIDPAKFLNLEGVKRRKLTLAKRPTGGGIVFHIWDLAFSVLVPSNHSAYALNTLENYAFVNRAVKEAVEQFLGRTLNLTATEQVAGGFCMAKPTKYDVMLGGYKVAGAAQRKQRWGFLHQGTIAICPPEMDYLADIIKEENVRDAIVAHTLPLSDDLQGARGKLRQLLKKCLVHG